MSISQPSPPPEAAGARFDAAVGRCCALQSILLAFNMYKFFFHGPLEVTMSADPSQISATISAATKEKLDRFTESHGLKKNFVVEQALLFFMEARRELPDEALVPARIVLKDEDFERVVAMLAEPPAPTKALRELMSDRGN
ncbi:MAG: DUF1778 domain-containing protein [Gammaproteobacteria bacterium]